MAPPKTFRVVFRDAKGRFLKVAERYVADVKMVQVVRHREYITVAERRLKPDELVNVLNQREFESLPEALVDFKTYTSKSKYKAWDIARQIDETKRVRRKNLKYTVTIKDGTQLRKVSFYHNVKRNSESSYGIFRRINQEIGLEGMFLYDRVGGKILADRTGKQVSLINIKVEEVV